MGDIYQFYITSLAALIAGGNWNNGSHVGARAVNCENCPWNVNGNIGVRGACDLARGGGGLAYPRNTSKDSIQSERSIPRVRAVVPPRGEEKKQGYWLVAGAKGRGRI